MKFKIRKLRTAVLLAAAFMFMLTNVVSAAGAAASAPVSLEAKKVNGEVYVKADSLIRALGGSGTFDEKSGTFQYAANDQVPAVIEKVSPAVVGIIGIPDERAVGGRINRYTLSHGSGVIIKPDGWIVTNAHVVKDMKQIFVITADGKEYAATRKHLDEQSDLATVKIEASKLPTASFVKDTSNLKVGEKVVAIGTPLSFSLMNSASVGIISGLNRSVDSPYRLIQTDAAINPGNSGGPLVNMKGEIIGINSLKYASSLVDNLGFSIPADTVQYVLNHFFQYGKVKRPWSGMQLEESWAAIIGLPSREPLTVTSVQTGSPADKAGIRKGDVLYSIDGRDVSTIVDWNEAMKHYLPGSKAKLLMLSDGDLVTRTITFGETP
jgi:serine protease Do